MLVETLIEDDRWREAGLGALAKRACGAVLKRFNLDPNLTEISLMGCDDARIIGLNAQFRGKDSPTNVLSWPAQQGVSPADWDPRGMPVELGDIAISYDTCAREAGEQDKVFDDHVTHLLIHATLHLLGFDHIDEKEAAEMEGLEVEILGKLGIPDPYGEQGSGV